MEKCTITDSDQLRGSSAPQQVDDKATNKISFADLVANSTLNPEAPEFIPRSRRVIPVHDPDRASSVKGKLKEVGQEQNIGNKRKRDDYEHDKKLAVFRKRVCLQNDRTVSGIGQDTDISLVNLPNPALKKILSHLSHTDNQSLRKTSIRLHKKMNALAEETTRTVISIKITNEDHEKERDRLKDLKSKSSPEELDAIDLSLALFCCSHLRDPDNAPSDPDSDFDSDEYTDEEEEEEDFEDETEGESDSDKEEESDSVKEGEANFDAVKATHENNNDSLDNRNVVDSLDSSDESCDEDEKSNHEFRHDWRYRKPFRNPPGENCVMMKQRLITKWKQNIASLAIEMFGNEVFLMDPTLILPRLKSLKFEIYPDDDETINKNASKSPKLMSHVIQKHADQLEHLEISSPAQNKIALKLKVKFPVKLKSLKLANVNTKALDYLLISSCKFLTQLDLSDCKEKLSITQDEKLINLQHLRLKDCDSSFSKLIQLSSGSLVSLKLFSKPEAWNDFSFLEDLKFPSLKFLWFDNIHFAPHLENISSNVEYLFAVGLFNADEKTVCTLPKLKELMIEGNDTWGLKLVTQNAAHLRQLVILKPRSIIQQHLNSYLPKLKKMFLMDCQVRQVFGHIRRKACLPKQAKLIHKPQEACKVLKGDMVEANLYPSPDVLLDFERLVAGRRAGRHQVNHLKEMFTGYVDEEGDPEWNDHDQVLLDPNGKEIECLQDLEDFDWKCGNTNPIFFF